MVRKVTFLKNTPEKFSRAVLALLLLSFLSSKTAWALPFNADFFPSGQILEVEKAPLSLNLSDCSLSQGRIFNFTAPVSFRLSGVGLFFFEDYNSQNSLLSPAKLLVSIFSGDGVVPTNALIFRSPFKNNSSSYIKALSLFGNGQAKGLFFELKPLWLGASQTYTLLLECQNSSGPVQKIYGGSNNSGARTFDSTSFSASPETSFKIPYFQLYTKNDGLVNVAPATTLPSSRPIVLVHGLAGAPVDFSDFVTQLTSAGWEERYLLSFDYGLKTDGAYNGLASLGDLLPRFKTAVATLSATYKAEGGDGRVDLLAYSSGSVLARNYLGLNRTNPGVRDLISIGGLFKGSFLIDLEKGNENFPGVGTRLPLNLGKALLAPLVALNPLTSGRALSDNSFKQQLTSSGTAILAFKKEELPTSVNYYSLQGEIKARNQQNLFKVSVKSESSIGDGATLTDSASELPSLAASTFSESFDLSRTLTRGSATVSATLNLPDLGKLRFLHSQLLKAAEIKNKVLEILKK